MRTKGKKRKSILMTRDISRIVIFIFFLSYEAGNLLDSAFAQELHDGKASTNEVKENPAQANNKVTDEYIGFYQRFISEARGSECPMYPSCSNYGLRAFNDRPFFEAMLYTADRMLRCGHDKDYYEVTVQYGEKSLLDWPAYQPVPKSLIYRGSTILRTESSQKQDNLSFINYLINNKQYDMALLEINRAFYFHTSGKESLYRNKLLCYEALEREEDGVFDYEMSFPDSVRRQFPVALKAAKLYYNMDNFDMALSVLEKTEGQTDDEVYRKLIFQSVLRTEKQDYLSALSLLDEAKAKFPQNGHVIGESIRLVNQIKDTSLKNPNVARALSIIPGGGYAYAKQYQTALTSFLINAVLAYATYNCIKKDNYGMACLTGIFSLTFYFGNIMGGGKSAHRYNESVISRQINKLTEINGLGYY